jgi:16S rRNA G1207 methylase RsmC
MSDADSSDLLRVGEREGSEEYTFQTRDGLLSTDEIRSAPIALLDYVAVQPDDDILVVDGNYGILGVILADLAPNGETVVTETSARAAETCRKNADRNGIENLTVELTADISSIRDGFDLAVYAPKPFSPVDVVNERMAEAGTRLSPGGKFYISGAKSDGITRYSDILSDLFTDANRLGIVEACHVYCGTKSEAFQRKQYLEEHEFRASVGDYTCRFLTVPGLFSWESLDEGTKALLENVTVPSEARVLDCCCGYGAIGAFVGARTDCKLWATDDDVVATTYARRNLERNGVSPEAVVTGDGTDAVATDTFDVVLSNPPTHAGQGVTKKLFSGIHEVLAKDGAAYFVANEIMNYEEKLSRDFEFAASVKAEAGKYNVICAKPE